MNRRRNMAVLAPALLLVMLAGCFSGIGSDAVEPDANVGTSTAVRVSVARPDLRDIADRITVAGAVVPYEQVTLYARVNGYLNSIAVDIGDSVRKGQLLAELDMPEVEAELDEKRAAVAQAEAELKQARAAISQYEAEARFENLNYDRLRNIRQRDPDVLPQHDVDRARAGWEVARSRLDKANADVAVAEAAFQAAKAGLEVLSRLARYARITAPFSGVITERFVDPGDLIQAAESSRTQAAPVVSVARIDRVRVLVDVPEPQAPFVAPGIPATVRASNTGPIETRCSRTSGALNPATRTMRAEIHLANGKRNLRPGMTAEVTFHLQTVEDTLTVPVSAIRSDEKGYGVFVVRGETAERRLVKTGLEASEWIQVIEGLDPDDQVVIAAADALADGTRVVITGEQQ